MKKNINAIQDLKKEKQQISMLTCYDALHAELMDAANIDCLLVGDSVGTNILGYDSEQDVTLADMIHHTAAVARKTKNAFIITDLPYQTYETPQTGLESAQRLIQAGADAIKFEGYQPDLVSIFVQHNIIPICHLGLLPQTAAQKRLQATTIAEQKKLLDEAKNLEKDGAAMLIVECIPNDVTQKLSQALNIPVIGIAAGPHCDGQVQVITDVLGLSPKTFKHARPIMQLRNELISTYTKFHQRIKNKDLIS